MRKTVKTAVPPPIGAPLAIEQLPVPGPQAGEVLITAAAGDPVRAIQDRIGGCPGHGVKPMEQSHDQEMNVQLTLVHDRVWEFAVAARTNGATLLPSSSMARSTC